MGKGTRTEWVPEEGLGRLLVWGSSKFVYAIIQSKSIHKNIALSF